ncbi:MAG: type II secretion system major pseudopilin GspG [Planctomycetota bacterium]|nr:type II secretion system major pseudopilin GspG [Planctomycetota bacterium]
MRNGRGVLRRMRRAFTLIEVMIVILIVLALGGLVAYNLLGKKEEADDKLVEIDMNTLKRALKDFRFTHNRYPTDDEGLAVLWNKEATSDEEVVKKWTKLLEEPMPTDRYGNQWGYRQQSEHSEESIYDIWSYGRDKLEGTDDDIVSWKKEGEEDDMGGSSPTPPPSGG